MLPILYLYPDIERKSRRNALTSGVAAAFRKLAELQLIWEKRCGRGDANQIYLASVTPIDDSSYECAPFSSREYESCGFRTADAAFLDAEEPQDTRPQNPGIPAFRTADSDVPEPQNPGASNTDFSQPDTSFSDVSLSVPSEDGPTLSLIHIYKYHLNTFKC